VTGRSGIDGLEILVRPTKDTAWMQGLRHPFDGESQPDWRPPSFRHDGATIKALEAKRDAIMSTVAEKPGNRVPVTMGLVGDAKTTIAALLPRLHRKSDRTFLDKALRHYHAARAELDELGRGYAGA
jgi:hypothetical protein